MLTVTGKMVTYSLGALNVAGTGGVGRGGVSGGTDCPRCADSQHFARGRHFFFHAPYKQLLHANLLLGGSAKGFVNTFVTLSILIWIVQHYQCSTETVDNRDSAWAHASGL